MLAAIRSAAVLGVDAFGVTVEVHVASGLPQITVVGLPAGAVKESRDRVLTALVQSGFPTPPRRITVNLAPADVRKDGTGLDLPIALGVLVAMGHVPAESLDGVAAIGELALDGTLRSVRGSLPVAAWARRAGLRLVLPPANVAEASRVGAALSAPVSLSALVQALASGALPPAPVPLRGGGGPLALDDFAEVVGQEAARRALEVAAAGGHHVLLVGPPGAGKTMLARRLPSILPALDEAEALEVLAIRSVAGLPVPEGDPVRPFRAPHHTVSSAALVGGGSLPRPGEVTLAHLGVLFLDELLEFPRVVLDALRQPLEDGELFVSRAQGTVRFPARVTLVAATNPCPCGRAGESPATCVCTPEIVARYQARLSGPLADRIDMHLRVGAVPPRAMGAATGGESSASVRERVERARSRQRARFAGLAAVQANAQASGRWLDVHGGVTGAARERLVLAAERLGLSARAFHRVLKVARTIADLDDSPHVHALHVDEALRTRPAAHRPATPPVHDAALRSAHARRHAP